MSKKNILIVGGTRGIGREIVQAFENQGHKLSVIGRHIPPNVHKKNNYWDIDLSNTKLLSTTIKDILKQTGKISHLVFCQRFRGKGNDWKGEVAVSLTATKLIIEQTSAHFDTTPERSIAIIASLSSILVGHEQPVSYHIGKAALVQLTRYFAVLLGPKGIRVNCVSPCTILKEESKNFYLENTKLHNLYKKIIPLRRMGTAREVADVIIFLCSPQSSFITGQNIVVDGGLSLSSQERLARDLQFGGK